MKLYIELFTLASCEASVALLSDGQMKPLEALKPVGFKEGFLEASCVHKPPSWSKTV